MNWKKLLSFHIQTLPPIMHHKWKEIINFVKWNNQWKIIGDQLPMKSPIEFKG